MAALAGGAALLAGRRGTAQGVSGADKAKFTADAAYSPAPVTGTDYPGANKVIAAPAKVTNKGFQTRFTGRGGDGTWKGPGQLIAERRLTAGNKVPPSMRGGAETAQGFVRRVPTGVRTRMGNTNYGWSTTPYKKGGRVGVGKAKRGFGRALKKGK